jgi:hypothetical protein
MKLQGILNAIAQIRGLFRKKPAATFDSSHQVHDIGTMAGGSVHQQGHIIYGRDGTTTLNGASDVPDSGPRPL